MVEEVRVDVNFELVGCLYVLFTSHLLATPMSYDYDVAFSHYLDSHSTRRTAGAFPAAQSSG